MSSQEYFSRLPEWAASLARDVTAKTATLYVLHGAPQDLVRGSKGTFGRLETFLADDVFGTRASVLTFNRAEGFGFGSPEARSHFYRTLTGEDAGLEALPRDPLRALPLFDRYLRRALLESPPRSMLVLFPFAETLAPGGDALSLSPEDRASIIWLRRWSQDPVLRAADVTIVLETENLSDLDGKLVRSPYTRAIEIPRASAEDRAEFLSALRPPDWYSRRCELPLPGFVSATAGMTRLQLQQIADAADSGDVRIRAADLMAEKSRIIEAECYGLLEFVRSPFTLADVAGHEGVKSRLRAAARAIARGEVNRVPQGYLICGPVGSAKTFLVNAFSGEIGFPVVRLLNFRSQWQGVTEANVEKILKVLASLNPVVVVIDEADAFLGNREQQGDSGTSNRVFAALSSFMGETRYRGRIVWFLITSRPDLIPIDLKRQGRAEEHLALFYPASAGEYDELFRILVKKSNARSPVGKLTDLLDPASKDLSGADLEAILSRALLRSPEGSNEVSAEALKSAFEDFLPATPRLEREYQILTAALECTSREILPGDLQGRSAEDLHARLAEVRDLLRSRR
ncbi:MAG TPA: AAA family ATPase [Thermoanaerobaculia bacterium]|nr:AAA family ATPase [Thermoanaerobaculia bacterium]